MTTHSATTRFERWLITLSVEETLALADEAIFEAGYEAAERRIAPLIEAARAYRDAHKDALELRDVGGWRDVWALGEALKRAARTLEGHVDGD